MDTYINMEKYLEMATNGFLYRNISPLLQSVFYLFIIIISFSEETYQDWIS